MEPGNPEYSITWQGQKDGVWQIFYWENGITHQVTNGTFDSINPIFLSEWSEEENREIREIVWQGFDGEDYEIFKWDRNKIEQLTYNNLNDQNPATLYSGVAWESYDGNDWEICGYDLLADLKIHSFIVEDHGRRWDPLRFKIVLRNRGRDCDSSFYFDIYKNLISPPNLFQIGDVSRSLEDLDDGKGIAFTGYLSFDMDGTYNVYAQVDTDNDENEQNENNNIAGPFKVTIDPDADLDRDGDVDGIDLAILAKSFGSSKNDFNYEPLCDFVYDWEVNGYDLKAFVPFLGKTNCPCFM